MREHNKRLSVRLIALFVSARRSRKAAAAMTSSEREELRVGRLTDVVASLNAVTSFAHPVRASQTFKAKPHGGERCITRFDWVDDARLRVLVAALTPFADLHESQFLLGRQGSRGTTAVREALLQALRYAEEDDVFLQFDVKDFFGSIAHSWLEDYLPFDKGTVRRFVHTGEMRIETLRERRGGRRITADASNENGRSGFGIPQGSALSSLVAEMVMADVLRSSDVFDGLRLFTWSDNLGVLASRSEAFAVVEHVRAAFARHGAGPFRLTIEQTPINSEFKFLGVWYRVQNGEPSAFIPEPVATGWENSVCADILTAGYADLCAIEHRVRGKEAAWSFWPGMAPLAVAIRARVWSAWEGLDALERKHLGAQPVQRVATRSSASPGSTPVG